MEILWVLFGILSILLHLQNISGEEHDAVRNEYYGPLVLTQEGNPPKLKLSIPRKVPNSKKVARYSYDGIGEYGPSQEFRTACPAHTDEQMTIESNWRKTAKGSAQSKLFFLEKYTSENMLCWIFDEPPGPSIQKTDEDCGKSKGKIFEVGYPVLNEGKKVQLMAIYEICHSKVKTEGIIYTKHRIHSPSLLLLKVYNYYQPGVFESFTSSLDAKLTKIHELYKRNYIWQFVPRYDMPTVLWENTTLFPFNYTSIGTSEKMLKSMMKYDNVVRLFSKMTDKPLTIYSGRYQTAITEDGTTCIGTRCKKSVPINSFWRVIVDDNNKSMILITQHTKKICGSDTEYMCYEDLLVLERYDDGGCTYMCSLSNTLIDSLHLPKWNIEGKLDIRYSRTVKLKSEITPQSTIEQSGTDAQFSSTEVDISDFGRGANFVAALKIADAATAQIMKDEGAIDPGYRDGYSDGQGAGNSGGTVAEEKVTKKGGD